MGLAGRIPHGDDDQPWIAHLTQVLRSQTANQVASRGNAAKAVQLGNPFVHQDDGDSLCNQLSQPVLQFRSGIGREHDDAVIRMRVVIQLVQHLALGCRGTMPIGDHQVIAAAVQAGELVESRVHSLQHAGVVFSRRTCRLADIRHPDGIAFQCGSRKVHLIAHGLDSLEDFRPGLLAQAILVVDGPMDGNQGISRRLRNVFQGDVVGSHSNYAIYPNARGRQSVRAGQRMMTANTAI